MRECGGRTLEFVLGVFHEGFENLRLGERGERGRVWGLYHQGTVLLVVVAMFDLLSDGSRGFCGTVECDQRRARWA